MPKIDSIECLSSHDEDDEEEDDEGEDVVDDDLLDVGADVGQLDVDEVQRPPVAHHRHVLRVDDGLHHARVQELPEPLRLAAALEDVLAERDRLQRLEEGHGGLVEAAEGVGRQAQGLQLRGQVGLGDLPQAVAVEEELGHGREVARPLPDLAQRADAVVAEVEGDSFGVLDVEISLA